MPRRPHFTLCVLVSAEDFLALGVDSGIVAPRQKTAAPFQTGVLAQLVERLNGIKLNIVSTHFQSHLEISKPLRMNGLQQRNNSGAFLKYLVFRPRVDKIGG